MIKDVVYSHIFDIYSERSFSTSLKNHKMSFRSISIKESGSVSIDSLGEAGEVFNQFSTDDAQKTLEMSRSTLNKILRHDTASYTLTGTTASNQQIIPTLTIPAGTMKSNSVLRMEICMNTAITPM